MTKYGRHVGTLQEEVYYIGGGKECIFHEGEFILIPKTEPEAGFVLKSIGYKPYITLVFDKVQYVEGDFIEGETGIYRELIQRTPEEITKYLSNLRNTITRNIESTSKFYLDQITNKYGLAKVIQFQEYKRQIEAGNSAWFEKKAGPRLTGAQYMLGVAKPKIVAGDEFTDQVIAIETTLNVDLMACLDEDLPSFDYKTMWDEIDDFIDPPIEEVPASWWSAFKNNLTRKVW